MKNITIIASSIILALASCKKEKTPEINELKGNWIEQTNNTYRHKLIFEDETMYFFKQAETDTLTYHLDKQQGLIFLQVKDNPSAGRSSHQFNINKEKKELSIWGLFAGVNTTETIFIKEQSQ